MAFIRYKTAEHSRKCVSEMNNKEMFGRTIKASIAKDNGKSSDYEERRTYSTSSYCYECREEGHFSYKCPKNVLGGRDPPIKKRKSSSLSGQEVRSQHDEKRCDSEPEWDLRLEGGTSKTNSGGSTKKKFRRNSYFSDEEDMY